MSLSKRAGSGSVSRRYVWISGSGSVPKFHGSGTLELTDLLLRKMRVDFKSMEEEMDQLAGTYASELYRPNGLNSVNSIN
jgi:hypothetical protein